jgi:hypothetical protein
MAKNAPKRVKFKLGLSQLRKQLATAEQTADQAVIKGQQRLRAAIKRKDLKAIAQNTRALSEVKRARENLGMSVHLLALACVDQFLNCDPDFL